MNHSTNNQFKNLWGTTHTHPESTEGILHRFWTLKKRTKKKAAGASQSDSHTLSNSSKPKNNRRTAHLRPRHALQGCQKFHSSELLQTQTRTNTQGRGPGRKLRQGS
eukprot:5138985-Karenia_brevis.AAC.1